MDQEEIIKRVTSIYNTVNNVYPSLAVVIWKDIEAIIDIANGSIVLDDPRQLKINWNNGRETHNSN